MISNVKKRSQEEPTASFLSLYPEFIRLLQAKSKQKIDVGCSRGLFCILNQVDWMLAIRLRFCDEATKFVDEIIKRGKGGIGAKNF